MKKYLLLMIACAFSAVCFAQTGDTKSKNDTGNYVATINFALMDRVLSQQDVEDTRSHSTLNASFRICAKRLRWFPTTITAII